MAFELFVAVVVVSLDGRVLDRPVHAFNLAVRPRMIWLGQSVLDPVRLANYVEPHWPRDDGVPVSRLLSELDAVVCEDSMDAVGNGLEEKLQKLPRRLAVRLLDQLRHRELTGSVNGYKEIELALCCPKLDNVDVE